MAKERINFTLDKLNEVLESQRFNDGVERYKLIRRYCFGKVIDGACGVGYGSFILSSNPDVEEIISIDINPEAINQAKQNFSNDKTTFLNFGINDIDFKADTLVSLETIEHIENLKEYADFVERVSPEVMIISFPNKKSTHFNRFHFHDLNIQQLCSMFNGYAMFKKIIVKDVTIAVMLRVSKQIPNHIYKDVL